MPAALEGITVLDLTRTLAGPFCTMQLADMGAEVIKVEEPTRGDESRHWAPFWNGISCYYLAANRNKRSIGLNLKRPEAVDVVKRIAERADVLIESYRAGAVDALGLSYEDVKALNPGIIYCSVSGYGRTGPAQDKPGYDLMLQAYGGVMSVTGEPGRQPVRIGYSLVDITCGWIAYAGIMTALFQRGRTGRGQRVEASLLEGQMAASSFHTISYLATGQTPEPLGTAHPALAPYQMFATSDGYFILGVANDGLWERFCNATRRPDLLGDPRFKTNPLRVEHRDELIAILSGMFAERASSEWMTLLDEAGVPNSPINDIPTLVDDPQVQAREMVIPAPHPEIPDLRMPGSPIRMADSPATVRYHPPRLGEHTDEVLGELGYTAEDVARLREVGALGE